TRFALMYPETVTHLILENPIGLEDYRDFVPYASIEDLYANELKTTEEGMRHYQKSYYVLWKPDYEEYVQIFARWKLSGEYPRLAMSSALTYQMIYEQPVCHEFSHIKANSPHHWSGRQNSCRQVKSEKGYSSLRGSIPGIRQTNCQNHSQLFIGGDKKCRTYSSF